MVKTNPATPFDSAESPKYRTQSEPLRRFAVSLEHTTPIWSIHQLPAGDCASRYTLNADLGGSKL